MEMSQAQYDLELSSFGQIDFMKENYNWQIFIAKSWPVSKYTGK